MNCSLWNAPQSRLLSILSLISCFSSILSQKKHCTCVFVCALQSISSPKQKADRRCASHLRNFPKTAGLLPVHSLTLNQPQSATYSLKCLQPVWVRTCVCVCGCSSDFLLFAYAMVFKILFLRLGFLFQQSLLMIKHGEILIHFFHCQFSFLVLLFLGAEGPILNLYYSYTTIYSSRVALFTYSSWDWCVWPVCQTNILTSF